MKKKTLSGVSGERSTSFDWQNEDWFAYYFPSLAMKLLQASEMDNKSAAPPLLLFGDTRLRVPSGMGSKISAAPLLRRESSVYTGRTIVALGKKISEAQVWCSTSAAQP